MNGCTKPVTEAWPWSPGLAGTKSSRQGGSSVRITSMFDVMTLHFYTRETFDPYLNARQTDTAWVPLAVNSKAPTVKLLMIEIMQDHQAKVNAIPTEADQLGTAAPSVKHCFFFLASQQPPMVL
ncbi:Helicase C-terminal [Penicillium concentricum]|uniref:Helicase C-terminal n=1 Tax=Penicillium concentricum TaxID=293559 RepID=A0A9W9R8R1_9EURO|nr:Helicase C-terminal [Penicillium concentricum]KAJ5355681.1 Helicase C-terminal [Penicillium concentricum]